MIEEQPKNTLKIINIVLILLSIVLLCTVALLINKYNASAKTIAEYESTIDKQKEAIATLSKQYIDYVKETEDLSNEIETLQSKNSELVNVLIDTDIERSFWHEYAVIVTSTGSKYHTYGCQHVDGQKFWIYNIEAAKAKGYTACLDCSPPQ